MAWLTTPTGNRYYYRRRKVNGRVISEYVGAGALGVAVANLDALERRQVEAQQEAWRTVKAEQAAIDAEVDSIGQWVQAYVDALHLVTGHHQHKRQWRKSVKAIEAPLPSDKFDPGQFKKLLAAVDKKQPAQADLVELHLYLREHPGLANHFGNLAATMQDRILGKLCGATSTGELVKAHCAQLRASLHYDDSSGLEQLVIDNIILAWVRWQDCEWWYQNHVDAQSTIAVGDYWERRLTMAQHRYLKALEALARVRRLLKEPRATPAFNLLVKQQVLNQITK